MQSKGFEISRVGLPVAIRSLKFLGPCSHASKGFEISRVGLSVARSLKFLAANAVTHRRALTFQGSVSL